MKFLFLQDIYSSRYKFILLASLGALILLILYVLDRRLMLYCMQILGFIAAMLSVRFLYDDDKKVKWEEYQRALPIKKSTIVNEKFIFILIIAAILIAVNFLVLMLSKDRWYFGNEVEVDYIATSNIMLLFFIVSAMFILLMGELVSGSKSIVNAIYIFGILLLLGVTSVSMYIIQTNYYTYFLDDMKALTIYGFIILIITIVSTYTISLLCAKKGRDIL